jgi:hypothetical protein
VRSWRRLRSKSVEDEAARWLTWTIASPGWDGRRQRRRRLALSSTKARSNAMKAWTFVVAVIAAIAAPSLHAADKKGTIAVYIFTAGKPADGSFGPPGLKDREDSVKDFRKQFQ